MKKLITVIALVLVSSLLLVGCSNPPIPSKVDRWQNPETINYNVKLEKELVDGSQTEYKPFYTTKAGATIAPDEAIGTYFTTIVNNENNTANVLTYELSVNETYLKTDLPVDYMTAADAMVGETETTVTFKSKSTSSVTFASFPKGSPISSSKTVNGVYIYRGLDLKPILIRNNYQVNTTYVEDTSTVKSTFNHFNKESGLYDLADTKIPATSEQKFVGATFDNEQLYFLIRSFNLDTLVTSGSQTVAFYNASIQKSQQVLIGNAANGEVEVTINETKYTTYIIGAQISEAGKSGGVQTMYFEKNDEFNAGTSGKVKSFKMIKMILGHLTLTLA